MKSFKSFYSNNFIVESTQEVAGEAESHLTHLEDLAIEEGKNGFLKFVAQVENFTNYIEGLESKTNVNLKIDGAPALFFGVDPRPQFKGQFFIATKSVFAQTPNLIHSVEEVDVLYKDAPQGLKDVLKTVFPYFQKGYDNSGYLYQGDLLFTPSRPPVTKNIQDKEYLTFQPNLITYAIPVDQNSKLYNKVVNSSVGIVIHAKFNVAIAGNGLTTSMAGRDVNSVVKSLQAAGVFAEGSNYSTISLKLDPTVKSALHNLLNDAKNKVARIDNEFNNAYLHQPVVVNKAGKKETRANVLSQTYYLQQYLNYMVRQGGGMFKAAAGNKDFNAEKFKAGFLEFFDSKINKAAEGKGPRAQSNAATKKQEIRTFLEAHVESFNNLIDATYDMYQIKNVFLKLLTQATHQLDGMKGFIPVGDSYISQGEGHVLYIGNTGNQVKIVDRLNFSANNFLYAGARGRTAAQPQQVTEDAPVNETYSVGFFGGGFNPPHIGHFEAAKIAAQENNDVYIVVSPQARDASGITTAKKQAIWELYRPLLETYKAKIHIIIAQVSPVGTIYEYVATLNDSPDANLIYVNLYTDVEDAGRYKNMEKYSNNLAGLELKPTPRLGSGTEFRAFLAANDKQRAFALLPNGVDKAAVWNILTSQ